MRALPLLLLLVGCAGQQKPTCTPEGRAALLELYKEAGRATIQAGKCDAYQKVEQCPAAQLIEQHFVLAEKGLCGQ